MCHHNRLHRNDIPTAKHFFLIPVFSSSFPRKSVTMFFSFRNVSARSRSLSSSSEIPMVKDYTFRSFLRVNYNNKHVNNIIKKNPCGDLSPVQFKSADGTCFGSSIRFAGESLGASFCGGEGIVNDHVWLEGTQKEWAAGYNYLKLYSAKFQQVYPLHCIHFSRSTTCNYMGMCL